MLVTGLRSIMNMATLHLLTSWTTDTMGLSDTWWWKKQSSATPSISKMWQKRTSVSAVIMHLTLPFLRTRHSIRGGGTLVSVGQKPSSRTDDLRVNHTYNFKRLLVSYGFMQIGMLTLFDKKLKWHENIF